MQQIDAKRTEEGSAVKAKDRGTPTPPQDSEMAEHLDSLMSNRQGEQDKWEQENNQSPEEFRQRFNDWVKTLDK